MARTEEKERIQNTLRKCSYEEEKETGDNIKIDSWGDRFYVYIRSGWNLLKFVSNGGLP
jgi:hypothetical protein